MIPKLRFPEFSGEWVERRLGEVCDSFSGGTPSRSKKYYFKGDIPFIKSGEISKEKTEEKITKEALKNSSAKLVKKGDLLIALYGATSGEVAISKIDGAINQAVLCLRCDIEEKFLFYWFELNKNRIITKYTQGGQPNLSAKIIKSLKIHLPPTLAEQEKIASFLSAVDEKIEITSKRIEKLKEYKKGLLQKLLNVKDGVPELRFPEFSGEWVEKRLGKVIKERNEKTIINNQYPVLTSSKEGIFFQREYFSKQTASENTIGYKVIHLGDFTYRSMSDSGNFTFNIQNLIDKGIVSPAYPVFRVIEKQANPLFIYYFLNNSIFIKKQISILRQGGTRLALNFNKLKQLKIQLPPTLAEQQKIAEFLSSIDEKIELNEKKLSKLKEYKRGLLQKMFV